MKNLILGTIATLTIAIILFSSCGNKKPVEEKILSQTKADTTIPDPPCPCKKDTSYFSGGEKVDISYYQNGCFVDKMYHRTIHSKGIEIVMRKSEYVFPNNPKQNDTVGWDLESFKTRDYYVWIGIGGVFAVSYGDDWLGSFGRDKKNKNLFVCFNNLGLVPGDEQITSEMKKFLEATVPTVNNAVEKFLEQN